MPLEVGVASPEFALANQFGETVESASLTGGAVVVFFPFAFSRICTDELGELRDNLEMFDAAGVALVAIAVDHKYTLRAFADVNDISFDLLADFWPHGSVTRAYDAFDEANGYAQRVSYVLDGNGTVRSVITAAHGQGRPIAEYSRALSLVEDVL
ncbi:redoxin domain-containing protein [Arthrobacter echini]|uniref:thioredoxin-dependent peroxiredoxin n=1 Tax=Arthrobacter echini TaxID=1529066 RepID=A0A4S5E693_9MICC|nr:redoxin domain-containing protein [Arthrobacter echini]THJ66972.1 redoxin domain-containing protein [Arthrobacter echini]